MEKTGSIKRKAVARHHKAEVMIAGEQLRLKLHDGKLIKERRYHLRTYPNCFVAEELIDWLVNHKEAIDRATAVCLMQHLMDHDIVHHVLDKQPVFKDANLLYRFRKDDGTFPFNTEVKIFMRGQRLYEHLIADKNSILRLREEHGVSYHRSFPGCQFIDWLLQNGETESRRQGLELSRALQEHGIIQHVTKKHDFFDSGLLYQFCINFRRRRRLSELLNESEQDNDDSVVASAQNDHHLDSPFVVHKSLQGRNNAFQSEGSHKDLKQLTSGRRGSLNALQLHSDGFPSLPVAVVKFNPKSGDWRCFGLWLHCQRCSSMLRAGCGSWKSCSSCWSSGVSVCVPGEWTVCPLPGLQNRLQTGDDWTSDSCARGYGATGIKPFDLHSVFVY
ncbi:DEP domain-containing mTOR-interacting protein isoform X2 [Gouania willdenowi]|uniref:DEP domain-containing mTOR-interacting protein isoform X2 n=1 Tax=Gouania willdenowi TaxID=441366 RepID=UPI0010555C32|nr:DEP domain-containing mTOR-interacting protein-like isoform X2 [Gouania willdenowi]